MADGVEGDRKAGQGTGDDVGSVAEEAAKLFGAFSTWAREHGSDAGHGLADAVDQNFANGAPECTFCPICRAVHAVRQCSPEVRQHLVVAAASLMQAASAIMTAVATPPADNDDPATRRDRVEHIDLDSEWEDD
ncbi:hypothetical protein [Nocardioides speluncae]|uniref:hypothetical protein n=1 Tax=Nocardioides speluncae TaxID=2670337 RepID=UPI000D690D6B|nr:hypothetical protein [Nocardioides speluncae]